ncbi:MAG: FtsW/RodA/SpoVE family cell cycle protein [Gammaproteobacteria bacterium]|nr:FtsW/RodA/SpoVE family cell cycle protein [Gammaproteobacteria bacterium]
MARTAAGRNAGCPLGPVTIQPSEIAKIAVVIYLAGHSRGSGRRSKEARWFARTMMVTGGIAALILIEPHLGATMVLLATILAVLLVGGARREHLTMVVAAGLLLVSLSIATHPYQQNRLRAWLHPDRYEALGAGRALRHRSGAGRTGGAGHGPQHRESSTCRSPTDSALAVVGEELGFLGCTALLGLFGLFAWRGLLISGTCADEFGRLLAAGLTTLIVFQAFFNFGVTTGLLPQTGVGLPFISYGSSSLCCFMGAVGLIVNVSRLCVPQPSRRQRRRQQQAAHSAEATGTMAERRRAGQKKIRSQRKWWRPSAAGRSGACCCPAPPVAPRALGRRARGLRGRDDSA